MANGVLLFLFLIVMPLAAQAASPASIAQTGQTACWNESGTAVNCSGTGQDGEIRAGVTWPKTRFVDNGNGTVSDNLTGLVWLKNANCFGPQNWASALYAANNLANGSFCGLNDGSKPGDWRLPNRTELESLLDSQQANPSLTAGYPFVNLQADYWSSSSYAPLTFNAWHVNIGNGLADTNANFTTLATLPVRSAVGGIPVVNLPATGQTSSQSTGDDGDLQKGVVWPVPRFVDNNNQTITDNLTGLVWSRNTLAPGPDVCLPGGLKTWSGALAYVTCLNSNSYLGFTDWRLPNRKELASLINLGQQDNGFWLTQAGFINLQGNSLYWSSTTVAGALLNAWSLLPGTGRLVVEGKPGSHVVWPVRGGVVPLFGNLTVSPSGGDFGSITVGESSAPQTFTLGNTGKGDLTVSAITIAGNSPSSFIVTPGSGSGGSCGTTPTIAPKGSCTVSVTFTPASTGVKSAVLRIASDDPDTPQKDTPLGGTGLLPEYTVSTTVIGGHGDISCTPKVFKGGSSFCTITPESGYFLSSFTDNGVSKMDVVTSSYTITKIASNHVIVGSFSQNPPPIDGSCGTSNGKAFTNEPTANLCASGTASMVTGNGSWHWNCAGLNGGQTASCSAERSGTVPVLINGGAAYATTPKVWVTCTPPGGEDLVRLSNDGSKWGKWLTLVNPVAWKLAPKDGLKTVFAQFRKSSSPEGGTSTVYNDTITLDVKPPSGTMRINGGATITNNRTLSVNLTASDITSGVEGVCLKETKLSCLPGEFIPFAAQVPFQLQDSPEGKKTVYATLRDRAGKLSKPLKGKITVDTTPPDGTLVINGDKPTTPTTAVTLKLKALKAAQMQLSFDGGATWGAWEKFVSSKKVVLLASGLQTVGARFMDAAGNVSSASFDSIEVVP